MDHRRPRRHDVGVALRDVVRVLAVEPVEERRVSIEVIEILEQRVAVGVRQVFVGLELRDRRGDLDRRLLVADRRLDRIWRPCD